MDKNDSGIILTQVQDQVDFEKLNEICEHLKDALREILTSCGLYFRIFSRVKSSSSVVHKLSSGEYGDKKIQDIIGLRIVLYYYDDLTICQDIMESIFKMDGSWSKTSYDADEFKAAKINGVFQIPEEYFNIYTAKLWSLPIDKTFEIQFRTVFFEGWHEIEHDMRYKSTLSDEKFWQGSEELSRILNCILANLELCDWSLVQLFEQLSYNHYKKKNWELMLKSRFRIHMDEQSHLAPEIIELFDNNTELAKQFFKCSRSRLINELIKFDNPHVTYDLIVNRLNESYIKDPKIRAIYKETDFTPQKEEKVFQKTTLRRLETSILFQLHLPLMHKETRVLENEFVTASSMVYKWAKNKIGQVFTDMPETIGSYSNKLPGYFFQVLYKPKEMEFALNMHHFDTHTPGTVWHTETLIYKHNNGKLYLYHKTARDMFPDFSGNETFSKPSFLSEISTRIGLEDVVRIGNKPVTITDNAGLDELRTLINSKSLRLPVIIIAMQLNTTDAVVSEDAAADMSNYSINGVRLAKVTGLYSHVYLLDALLLDSYAEMINSTVSTADGSVCIIWPEKYHRAHEIYTKDMIYDASFDFNKFAINGQNLYEKAFRHKLVQMIKDANVNQNDIKHLH